MGKYFSSHTEKGSKVIADAKTLYIYGHMSWNQCIALLNLCDNEKDDYEHIRFAEMYLYLLQITNNTIPMDIQDKVGRELAKDLLDKMKGVTGDNQDAIDLIKNLKLYKFFLNKPTYISKDGKHFGLPRAKRDQRTAKIILPYEVDKLLDGDIITKEQAENLITMITGSEEDCELAAECINQFRTERLKKKK